VTRGNRALITDAAVSALGNQLAAAFGLTVAMRGILGLGLRLMM
jgi:hypothetical protein